jgi:O-antigen/teichoic acid export membrane protein
VGRNVRFFGISQLVEKLAGFLAVVVAARFLGQVDFGRYTVALSLVSLLTVVLDFGISKYLVREGAQRPAQLGRTLGHALAIRALLGSATAAMAIPISVALGLDAPTRLAVALFAIGSLLRVIAHAFLSTLQALERLRDVAVLQAQESVAEAGAVAAVAAAGGGVIGVSWAVLGVSAVYPLWAWLRLRRHWKGRILLEIRGLWTTFRSTAAFAVSAGLATGLTYLDSVMVSVLRGNAAAGRYGAAYRIMLALLVLPTVLSAAVARSISYLAVADRPAMTRLYSRTTTYLLMAALPVAVGGAIVAGPLLGLIFGAAFEPAATALGLLLGSLVLMFPNWPSVTLAYAVGRERAVAGVFLLVLAFNAGTNLAVIPRWGIEGAAATTLGSEVLLFVLVQAVLRRAGIRPAFGLPILKAVAAAAVMSVVVIPLRGFPVALPIAVGVAIYGVALLALRAFGPEDRALLRGLIRTSRPSP